MKRKNRINYLLAFCFLTIGQLMHAQTILKDGVNAAGTTMTDGTTEIDWTLGEVAVSSYDDGIIFIDEGLLPITELIITAVEEQEEAINIAVFPNPTTSNVTINFPNTINVSAIKLINTEGALLQDVKVTDENELTISLLNYAQGNYFLQIYNEQGTLIKTNQIILTR